MLAPRWAVGLAWGGMKATRPSVNVAQACCQGCGGEWFELVGKDTDPDLYKGIGAFQLDGDGRITAKDGQFICFDCGEIVRLPQRSSIPDGIGKNEMDTLEGGLDSSESPQNSQEH
jgi:hypothetical protein